MAERMSDGYRISLSTLPCSSPHPFHFHCQLCGQYMLLEVSSCVKCTNSPLPAGRWRSTGVTPGPGKQQETSGKLNILFVNGTSEKWWKLNRLYSRENPVLLGNNRELQFSSQDSHKHGGQRGTHLVREMPGDVSGRVVECARPLKGLGQGPWELGLVCQGVSLETRRGVSQV